MATSREDTLLLIRSTERDEEDAPNQPSSHADHSTAAASPRPHKRVIHPHLLPPGTRALEKLGLCSVHTLLSYKIFVYVLTFVCYATYHLSRKPFSVVKVVLCPECVRDLDSDDDEGNSSNSSSSRKGWSPFEGEHAKTLLGSVDYAELFTYAIAMFFSGLVADRVNLRYFLTVGLVGAGLNVVLMGVAYFARIHHLAYFLIVQMFGGVMQSTGLPGLVAVMGFWFGKQRRGLLLGLWNAHTAIGNILGTVIPSFWADPDDEDPPWGWSMIVPGLITWATAILIFLFLVVDPRHVGLPPPVHHLEPEPEQKEEDRDPLVSAEVETTISESSFGDKEQPTMEEKREEGVSHGQPYEGVIANGGSQADREEEFPPNTNSKTKAVGIWTAITIPGVIEYALSLFFNKLVIYSFLYWLPFYVVVTRDELSGTQPYWLAALYDVGAIIGGGLTGLISDVLDTRAVACTGMLLCAVPSLFFLRYIGEDHLAAYIILIIVCGIFISGPYAIITTAVSSDLGNHESLRGNQNAKATVTAFIDGTGSLGGATGPLLVGWITDSFGWTSAFYVFMVSCFLAALFLTRLVLVEGTDLCRRIGCVGWVQRHRYRLHSSIRRGGQTYQELDTSRK